MLRICLSEIAHFKLLPILLATTALASLTLLSIPVYTAYRDASALEAGMLRSSQALLVKSDPLLVIDSLPQMGNQARVLCSIDNEGGIYAIFGNYDSMRSALPYRGKGFSAKSKSPEALVGDDVNTYSNDAGEWFRYGDESYRVVGKLGFDPSGMLSSCALLKGVSAQSCATGAVVLDGDISAQGISERFPGIQVESINSGLDSLNAKDPFSAVFISLLLITSLTILAATGIVVVVANHNALQLMDIAGYSPSIVALLFSFMFFATSFVSAMVIDLIMLSTLPSIAPPLLMTFIVAATCTSLPLFSGTLYARSRSNNECLE